MDDHPKNNITPRQILEEAGIRFRLALSTADAMRMLEKERFDLIISDIGRDDNRSAGLDLIKQIKTKGINTPIVISASRLAIKNFGKEAKDLGALAVTSGTTEILNAVQSLLLDN